MFRHLETGHYILFILVLLVILLSILLYLNVQEVNYLRSETIPVINDIQEDVPEDKKVDIVSRHQPYIDKVETETGITLSNVAKLIIRDEGVRTRPYLDSQGIVTIGIGRSLQTNGISVTELHSLNATPNYEDILKHTSVKNSRIYIETLQKANDIFVRPLDKHDLELLLMDDLQSVVKEARSVFTEHWNQIDSVRQEVIINLIYNLGLPHFKGFHDFISSVKDKDWNKAASDLLLSDAARNNITRYHRNASVIQTGDPKYFELD